MASLRIIRDDPYLEPFRESLEEWQERIKSAELKFSKGTGSLVDFANGHNYFGIHKHQDKWVLREYAPNATAIYLCGNFNNWEKTEDHCFTKKQNGEWELSLPLVSLAHLEEYKLWIEWPGGADFRIPLFARRVVQDPDSKLFNAQVWSPVEEYAWKNNKPDPLGSRPLLVYESHIGMAAEEEKVGTYIEFTEKVLPRISQLGYNTVQLMAIQEHPYYGSFGYHVSSFFAPSSRFGTPEELKELIDTAHSLGIFVIMDLVHSHSVKNTLEGPGLYDGSTGMLFHSGPRREHAAWDSLCFDYGRDETVHFLLSNCKYWLEEFHFDGFRFDGITSMLYQDHGLERSFSSYADYFTDNTDIEAIKYLALANNLIHELNPDAISIAEDMSGLPGLGVPVENGGLGFDYRLAMGVPDFWIKTIKEKQDEIWDVNEIYHELTNYRNDEKVISYAESHDQALVGDKTIIFRLADKEMYSHMSTQTPSLIIDRAVSLHKLIRMMSLATNGGGYLNFMGNEFGHPEWIDFPREGNNWSFKYARRQWSLLDDNNLKYQYLNNFDRELIHFFNKSKSNIGDPPKLNSSNKEDQVISFYRGEYLFVFNFNPGTSFTDYGIPAGPLDYKILLNSDSPAFGGFNRVDDSLVYEPDRIGELGSEYQLKLYLPNRSALVLKGYPIPRIK